jgi:hypothetical protein
MPIVWDFEGRAIRLTDERRDHILEHPETSALQGSIGATLRGPEAVVQSLSDPEVRLYYRHYAGTFVGDKFLCVVVKVTEADAFVVTAYLTDRMKKGRRIWPVEP